MLANKTKGYLIHQRDYHLYDEILTYITEDGFIRTFYALGVKKINSKNSRAINYGNLVEIEFFSSHNIYKMSKLKKIVNISEFNLVKTQNLALILMNGLIYIQKYIDKHIFNLYQEILVLINREYNEYFLSILVFIRFLNYFTKYLGNFKTINNYFYNYLINKNGLKLNKSEIELLESIIQENITIGNLYKLYSTTINFETLFFKIYVNWKDLILKKGK